MMVLLTALSGLFFSIFVFSAVCNCSIRLKILPLLGFEPQISCVGNYHSATCALTKALNVSSFLSAVKVSCWRNLLRSLVEHPPSSQEDAGSNPVGSWLFNLSHRLISIILKSGSSQKCLNVWLAARNKVCVSLLPKKPLWLTILERDTTFFFFELTLQENFL